MADEVLDLVNERDEVVATGWRSAIYEKNLLHHLRAVWLFIRRSDGRLWIPRRVATKARHASALDASMAGHVGSGESYDEAFVRETVEELNLDPRTLAYRKVGYVTPAQQWIRCFSMIYEIRCDEVPDYNRDDYMEYFWLTPQEILERAQEGEKVKPQLPFIVADIYRDAVDLTTIDLARIAQQVYPAHEPLGCPDTCPYR